jgi:hypothetical protein
VQENDIKGFFKTIRRSIKTAYFIASIIPLGVLVYFALEYVYPLVLREPSESMPLHIGALLLLAVVVSVLGLVLSVKATNKSISSVQSLHERLNSLIEITKQFRATPFLDVLLNEIVKSAIRLNSSDAGSLLLFDDEQHLRFRVALGKASRKMKDKVVKRGEGISGWVADKGEPAIVNDTTKDSRYTTDFDRETGFKTRSIMCVPLIYNKKVIGVIEVLNRKDGIYTKEDERLLFSLADQAAISIAQSKASESQQSDMIQITSILVEAQDHFSQIKKGHARSVASYSTLIGKHIGLPEKGLKNLYYASLFHDLGFIRINISKPLKPSDYENIKKHPQIGYDMIKPLSVWSEAADSILNHHERFDGTGYPRKKKGEDIPIAARVISVADAFDVLTSKTSYKKTRLTFKDAMDEIEANSGTQFDPDVVKAFRSAMLEADMLGS